MIFPSSRTCSPFRMRSLYDLTLLMAFMSRPVAASSAPAGILPDQVGAEVAAGSTKPYLFRTAVISRPTAWTCFLGARFRKKRYPLSDMIWVNFRVSFRCLFESSSRANVGAMLVERCGGLPEALMPFCARHHPVLSRNHFATYVED